MGRLSDLPLSYAGAGATGGDLPAGYRVVRRSRQLGRGMPCFDAAAMALTTWEMHRGAGLTVVASAPSAAVGVDVVAGLGAGRLRVLAPCRVVYLVEEPRRRGFAYGTLPGHPERGEELFTVSLLDDESVVADIVAFSRPALWWSRLAGPIGRWTQHRLTERYLAALAAAAAVPTR